MCDKCRKTYQEALKMLTLDELYRELLDTLSAPEKYMSQKTYTFKGNSILAEIERRDKLVC